MIYDKIDITQFITSKYPNDIFHCIYFNNVTYLVTEEYKKNFKCDYSSLSQNQFFSKCFKSSSFNQLSTDICNAAEDCSFSLKRNGVYGKKAPTKFEVNQLFRCKEYEIYKLASNMLLKDKVRKYTYHHNRKNQQK